MGLIASRRLTLPPLKVGIVRFGVCICKEGLLFKTFIKIEVGL